MTDNVKALIARVRDPLVCTDQLHRDLADALEASLLSDDRPGPERGGIADLTEAEADAFYAALAEQREGATSQGDRDERFAARVIGEAACDRDALIRLLDTRVGEIATCVALADVILVAGFRRAAVPPVTSEPDVSWPGDLLPESRVRASGALSAHPAEETVTTVAEIEGLPPGSVVRSVEGLVFERAGWMRRYPWRTPNSTSDFAPDQIALPARVLYRPEMGG